VLSFGDKSYLRKNKRMVRRERECEEGRKKESVADF